MTAKQLQAPEGYVLTTVEGADYRPDDKGIVTLHVPHHEAHLRAQGYTDPGAQPRGAAPLAKAEEVVKAAEAPKAPAEPDRAPAAPHVFRFLESKGMIEGRDFVKDMAAVALITKLDELMKPAGRDPSLPPDPENMEYGEMKTFLKKRGIQFAANPAKAVLVSLVKDNLDKPELPPQSE